MATTPGVYNSISPGPPMDTWDQPAFSVDDPTCDDLRKCNSHGIRVNRCTVCWPGFLGWLGELCRRAIASGEPVMKIYKGAC